MVALEGQAGEFGSILTDAKEPAARSLEAAQAYDNIAKAMAEADERAQVEAMLQAEEVRVAKAAWQAEEARRNVAH